MKYKELIIGFLLVILLGLTEYFIIEFKSPKGISLFFLFLFSLVKVLYVVIRCFRRIVTIAHMDLPYHRFLMFIAANVVLIVFSFSIDYWSVFHLDPN